MGKEKPVPRRLQLRPEHIARMGGNISFTSAHFNTGPGNINIYIHLYRVPPELVLPFLYSLIHALIPF